MIISSESPLPANLANRQYAGKVSEIHHVLAFCRAFVGESATMASECAVLGVPFIYAARTGRGYTDEQESRFGLVINERNLTPGNLDRAIDALLQLPRDAYLARHKQLLKDKIDVAAYVTRCIETFPEPLRAYRNESGD